MTRKPKAERAVGAAPGAGRSAAKRACVQHREDLLDEALEESFPASDPPSIARPAGKEC